jgi:hypothetical protein
MVLTREGNVLRIFINATVLRPSSDLPIVIEKVDIRFYRSGPVAK